MTPFDCGQHEGAKRSVHQLLMTVAAVCCCYNALGFVVKGEPHLAAAALGYGVLTAFERHICACHRMPPC